jgi:hypothetical protein
VTWAQATAGLMVAVCAFLALLFIAWGQTARTWGERCGSAAGALFFSALVGAFLPYCLPGA